MSCIKSGVRLTGEHIQNQGTIRQKREADDLASTWRNQEDRNTDTQTDPQMHACCTYTPERTNHCSSLLTSEDTMVQTMPQEGFWVLKSLNRNEWRPLVNRQCTELQRRLSSWEDFLLFQRTQRWFKSQSPHGNSRAYLTPVQGIQCPLLAPAGMCCTDIHSGKTSLHITF